MADQWLYINPSTRKRRTPATGISTTAIPPRSLRPLRSPTHKHPPFRHQRTRDEEGFYLHEEEDVDEDFDDTAEEFMVTESDPELSSVRFTSKIVVPVTAGMPPPRVGGRRRASEVIEKASMSPTAPANNGPLKRHRRHRKGSLNKASAVALILFRVRSFALSCLKSVHSRKWANLMTIRA